MSNTLLRMPAKPLTPEQKQDAARLAAIFEKRKAEDGLTQAVLADILGYSVQSAVSQYLNAKIPLNVSAATKFASGLRCRVADFSPSIQSEIDKIAAFATTHKQGASLNIPQGMAGSTYTAIEMLLLPTAERVALSAEEQAAIAFMESTAAKREQYPQKQPARRLSYS
ncbi:hypothetical protein AXE65_00850 [Ventosimonas gracilis]|uniref:HTH cro/C1-type domain-containing protein n=1 Tax=Ventosimonas gracilis TaxID=1680762 RepID=A0A139SVT4_9GAMM|nr:helix-turn-helix transcriptional regulator [Ventosimonas gracilis]KXU38688.1 hypothetical protein AXE65_00850 [Ventosimonas gracilis]